MTDKILEFLMFASCREVCQNGYQELALGLEGVYLNI